MKHLHLLIMTRTIRIMLGVVLIAATVCLLAHAILVFSLARSFN